MMMDNVDVRCGLCGLMPFLGGSFGSLLGLPNIVTKKVYMRTSTSSGNDTYGAKKCQREHDKNHHGIEQLVR